MMNILSVSTAADDHWVRAGIIFYDKQRSSFIFGIDAKYNSICDLGGHRIPHDIDVFNTAIREAYEESLGLLQVNRSELIGSTALTLDDDVLFLITVDVPDPDHLLNEYTRLRDNAMTADGRSVSPHSIELSALTIVPHKKLMKILRANYMKKDKEIIYDRTWKVLRAHLKLLQDLV